MASGSPTVSGGPGGTRLHLTDAQARRPQPAMDKVRQKKEAASAARQKAQKAEQRKLDRLENTRTKYTMKELNGMSRAKLIRLAMATMVKNAAREGLTRAEALQRAELLMDGNTTPQLRKYINQRGKI